MNKGNTNKLITDFPKLYGQTKLPAQQTCMCWGFECGDGWFDLIYRLSKDIQEVCDREDLQVQACQVKEKYGGLRFYVDNGTDEIWDLINHAENMSEVTCEHCGKPGVQSADKGWISTRCEEHNINESCDVRSRDTREQE